MVLIRALCEVVSVALLNERDAGGMGQLRTNNVEPSRGLLYSMYPIRLRRKLNIPAQRRHFSTSFLDLRSLIGLPILRLDSNARTSLRP